MKFVQRLLQSSPTRYYVYIEKPSGAPKTNAGHTRQLQLMATKTKRKIIILIERTFLAETMNIPISGKKFYLRRKKEV